LKGKTSKDKLNIRSAFIICRRNKFLHFGNWAYAPL